MLGDICALGRLPLSHPVLGELGSLDFCVIVLRDAMSSPEIVLPITEPESEWVRGRAVRKVSPTRDHSRLQLRFGAALDAWSGSRGEVGTEWRFRVEPPGESRRPLVPDIAFVRVERLRGLTHADIQAPAFAPDVAVEILSPGDDESDVAAKVDVYLRAGTELVLVIDPKNRTVSAHDAARVKVFSTRDTLRHLALPEFELRLGPLFAGALDLPE